MIKSICATLLLCSFSITNFDFEYSNRDQFVRGITECTTQFNSALPPQYRAVVVISVAQAALESNWGESRFAREANNFYGMIQTDKTEPHIKALGSNILLKKYGRKCESVADYITLLNIGTDFVEYRKVRDKEIVLHMSGAVKPANIVNLLEYNPNWRIIGSRLRINKKLFF